MKKNSTDGTMIEAVVFALLYTTGSIRFEKGENSNHLLTGGGLPTLYVSLIPQPKAVSYFLISGYHHMVLKAGNVFPLAAMVKYEVFVCTLLFR